MIQDGRANRQHLPPQVDRGRSCSLLRLLRADPATAARSGDWADWLKARITTLWRAEERGSGMCRFLFSGICLGARSAKPSVAGRNSADRPSGRPRTHSGLLRLRRFVRRGAPAAVAFSTKRGTSCRWRCSTHQSALLRPRGSSSRPLGSCLSTDRRPLAHRANVADLIGRRPPEPKAARSNRALPIITCLVESADFFGLLRLLTL
jgi:hypothetical protein